MFHTFSILILFILTTNITPRARIRPERSSEPKITSTCYDHLGCVDINEKWYDSYYRPVNLEPLDRHTIRTEFLYMKPARNNSKDVLYDILTLKRQTLDLAGYKKGVYTFFLIHDFTSNGHTGWIKHMAIGIAGEMDANVISVDWEPGAEPPFDQAVANARVVALEMELFIKMLKEHFSIIPDKLHIIGHGLGAHIAGYVGKNIKGVNRITALDPTGPRFENMPSIVRLDPDDAKYVEVLHTEAFNSRSQGTVQPMGHSDFYLNNAGHQPGCNETSATAKFMDVTRSELREGKILPACSHKRAFKYYISAVTTRECKFVGIACSSYDTFLNGSCSDCDNNLCATFDFCPPPKNVYKTKFFVNTHSDPPFCMYAYQVNISIESNAYSKKLDGHFEFILTDTTNKLAFAVGSDFGSTARNFIPGNTYTLIVYAPPPAVTIVKEAKVRWRCKPTFPFLTKAIYVKYISIRRVPMMGESAPIVGLCPETGTEIKDASYIQFVCCDEARILEEQRIATMTTTTTIKTTTVPITTTTAPVPIANVTWTLANATTTTPKPPTQCLVKETGQPGAATPAKGEVESQIGAVTPAPIGGGNTSIVVNMTQTQTTQKQPEELTNKIVFDETRNETTTTTTTTIISPISTANTTASTKKEEVEEEEEEEEMAAEEKKEKSTTEMEEEAEEGETETTTIKIEDEKEETVPTTGFEITETEQTTTVAVHSISETLITHTLEITTEAEAASGTATPVVSAGPSSPEKTEESKSHTEQQTQATAIHTTESVSVSGLAKQTESKVVEATLESQTEIAMGMQNASHQSFALTTEENITLPTTAKTTEIPEIITPKSEEFVTYGGHNKTESSATEAGEIHLESTVPITTLLETEISRKTTEILAMTAESSAESLTKASTSAGKTEITQEASEECTEWNSTETDELLLQGGGSSQSKIPEGTARVSVTSQEFVTMVVEAVVTELITEVTHPIQNLTKLPTQVSQIGETVKMTPLTEQEGHTTQVGFEMFSKQTVMGHGVGITGEGAAYQGGKGVSSIQNGKTESSTGRIEGTEKGHTEVGEEITEANERTSKIAAEHLSNPFESFSKQTGGGQELKVTENAEAYQAGKGVSSVLEGQTESSIEKTGGTEKELGHTEVAEETEKASETQMEHLPTPPDLISKQTEIGQGIEVSEKGQAYQMGKTISSQQQQETGISSTETEHTEVAEATPVRIEKTSETPMQHLPTPPESFSEQTATAQEGHTGESTVKAEESEKEQTHTKVTEGTVQEMEKASASQVEYLASETSSKQEGTEETPEEIKKISESQTAYLTSETASKQAEPGEIATTLESQTERKPNRVTPEITSKRVETEETSEEIGKTAESHAAHLAPETTSKQAEIKETFEEIGKTSASQTAHLASETPSRQAEPEEIGETPESQTEHLTPEITSKLVETEETPEGIWKTAEGQAAHLASETTSKQAETEETFEQIGKNSASQMAHLASETTSRQAEPEEIGKTPESQTEHLTPEITSKLIETEETPEDIGKTAEGQAAHSASETTSKQAETEETPKEIRTSSAKQATYLTVMSLVTAVQTSTEEIKEGEKEHHHTEIVGELIKETERSSETLTEHLIITPSEELKESKEHLEETTKLHTTEKHKEHATTEKIITHHVTHPEHKSDNVKGTTERKNKTTTTRKEHKGTGPTTEELPECDEVEE